MKLLTKAIEKQLAKYPIYSQDGKGGKAQVIVASSSTPAAVRRGTFSKARSKTTTTFSSHC